MKTGISRWVLKASVQFNIFTNFNVSMVLGLSYPAPSVIQDFEKVSLQQELYLIYSFVPQGKSALEQKVHQLNARLVEIQGKYVNEQQEKQELRRIFRESTVGVVQLKAKVECEKIKNVDDYYGLR